MWIRFSLSSGNQGIEYYYNSPLLTSNYEKENYLCSSTDKVELKFYVLLAYAWPWKCSLNLLGKWTTSLRLVLREQKYKQWRYFPFIDFSVLFMAKLSNADIYPEFFQLQQEKFRVELVELLKNFHLFMSCDRPTMFVLHVDTFKAHTMFAPRSHTVKKPFGASLIWHHIMKCLPTKFGRPDTKIFGSCSWGNGLRCARS